MQLVYINPYIYIRTLSSLWLEHQHSQLDSQPTELPSWLTSLVYKRDCGFKLALQWKMANCFTLNFTSQPREW